MTCTRGTAVSLTVSQFIAMLIALMYAPVKRPLFLYTTEVSERDALFSYNASGFTMWFSRDEYREAAGVNPYIAAAAPLARGPSPPSSARLNSPFSRAHVYVCVTFALFMFPAFLACVYSFSSVRLVDSGQISPDAAYGDHGVKDSIMWEVTFWLLVFLQHAVVQCVLCSPVDAVYVAGTSFTVTVLLLAFCVLAANATADAPSRRFEGPVFILIAFAYFLIVSGSKVVLGRQFTFMMWFAHIAIHCLLVMGHLYDNPVTCQTVLNCRWTYVIMSCWFNVCLYVAY